MKKWTYVAILVLASILICSIYGYEKRQNKEREYWISRAAKNMSRADTETIESLDVDEIQDSLPSSEETTDVSEEDSTKEELQETSDIQEFDQIVESEESDSAEQAEEAIVSEAEETTEIVELLPLEVKQSATIQFLFVGLNQELYDEILPLMKEYGYTGIIGISEEQYQFPDGTISRKQFYNMVDSGWKTCLICPDSSEFASWYPDFKKKVKAKGLKDNNMVYFANKDYSTALNESIKANDIRIIFHQGESDYSVITHAVPFRNWYIGSCRLQKDSLMEVLPQLFTEGGNVTLTTVLDDQFDSNYNLEDFEEMLEYLSQYVKDGSLSVKDYKSVFRPDANW